MSQVSIPTANPGSPSATKSSDKVSRESLHHYLIEAARTMRRVELGVGITSWLCVLVIFLLAAILIDHWLWPLNTLARFAVLIFIVGWTVWWVPRKVLPLLFQSIHPEHAARKIERQYPEMKESLISWLQLSTGTEHSAPRGVLATVGRFAVRNLGGQDSTAIVDSANLIRLAALLFGFLLTGTVYLFASPKSGATSIARMLMPWSSIAPAARVRIVSVAPGTTTITQGTSLPVSVTVRGMHKGDQVFVRYDLSDGQQVGQRLKMSEDIEGVNYRLDFGKSFGGIHQPLNYWIDAGDASVGPFVLSVQVVPIVAIDRLDFEYPKYTKQKPRTVVQDGAIEAPEGTRVKLFAHANQPMAKSRLEFDPVVGNGVLLSSSRIIDIETQGTQLSGAWLLQLDKSGTNPTISSYRVKATNSLGESNGDPVIYKIKVLGDLPPEVRLQSDLPSTIDVPIDGSQEIEMRAVDPDFGLLSLTATATLAKDISKKTVFEKRCFESTDGTTAQVVKVFTFTPSEYDLKVGDRLVFRAIATDNRCKVGEDTPEPNQASSSPLEIHIVPAVSKQSAEKETLPGEKKENAKADKSKNGNKINNRNQKSTDDTNSDEIEKTNDGKSPKSQEKSNEKQAKDKGSKQDQKQENGKSQEKGSGQSESANSGESSDSEGSSQGDASSNQKNGSKGNDSKSNATGSKSSSSGKEESGSESEDQSTSNDNGTSSKTKGGSSANGKQSLRNQEKNWDKPDDDAEAFKRIDDLRKERESQEKSDSEAGEKQAGETQAGEKQAGEKQAGEKQAGEKQAGEKQAGEKQAGEKQAGEKQAGEKQAGEKQAGEKQAGEKQAGEKQAGDKQAGDKQAGDKQAGDKQAGEKQAGEKQAGEKQAGEKQAGEKQAGEKQAGEKQAGEKQAGEKQAGEKQAGEKQAGEKQAGEKQAGEKQAGEKQAGEKQAGEKQAGEKQAGEKQAGEKQAGEKQAGEKQAGEKQAGEKQAGEKQAGEKQAGEKQAGEKQAGEKQAGEKQAGETQAGEKQAGEKQAGEKQAGEKQAGEKQAGEKQAGEKQAGEKQAGEKQAGEKQAGEKQAGEKQAGEKQAGEKQAGEKQAGEKQAGEKQAGEKQAGDKQAGDKKAGDKSGTPSPGINKEGASSAGSSTKSGDDQSENRADPANKEYADKVTDLALEYLKQQKDQPDPELLKRLKWSEEDMKNFLQRWTEAKELARTDPDKKREIDATLKLLSKRQLKSKEQSVKDRDDDLKGFLEEGSRVRPPESLRTGFEQFRKAAGKR